jgi:hypothetical protein
MLNVVAKRAPARPVSARPIPVGIRRSFSLRVTSGESSLGLLDEGPAPQPGLSQKTRRTLNKIRTSHPTIGASVNVRWYPECTRNDRLEQAGQDPSSARTEAVGTTSVP